MRNLAIAFVVLAVVFAILTATFAALYETNRSASAPTSIGPSGTEVQGLSFEFAGALSGPTTINAKNFGGLVEFSPSVRAGIVTHMVSDGSQFTVPQVYTFTMSESGALALGDRLVAVGHEEQPPYDIFFQSFDNTAWIVIVFGNPFDTHFSYTWRFEDGEFKQVDLPNGNANVTRSVAMDVADGATVRVFTTATGKPYLTFNLFDEGTRRWVDPFASNPFRLGDNQAGFGRGSFDENHNFYGTIFSNDVRNVLPRYMKATYNSETKTWASDVKNQFAFPLVKYPDVNGNLTFDFINKEFVSLTVNPSGSSFMFNRGGTGLASGGGSVEETKQVTNTTWFFDTDALNYLFDYNVGGTRASGVYSGFAKATKDFDYYLVPQADSDTAGSYAIFSLSSDDPSAVLRSGEEGLPALVPYTIDSVPVNRFFRPCLVKFDDSTLALFCTNSQRMELYTANIS